MQKKKNILVNIKSKNNTKIKNTSFKRFFNQALILLKNQQIEMVKDLLLLLKIIKFWVTT